MVCVGFSAAGEKFTKIAETVSRNTSVFRGAVHRVAKCLIFGSNDIGQQHLLILSYKIVLLYNEECDLDPIRVNRYRVACSFSAVFWVSFSITSVRFTAD